MTEEELIEIEARAAAATPGPWEQVNKSVRVAGLATTYAPNGYSGGICNCLGSMRAIRNKEIDDQARDNAAFIASARLDIPALLAEVRRLRVELAKYADIEPGIYTEQWKWAEPSGTTAQRGEWKRTVVWGVPA